MKQAVKKVMGMTSGQLYQIESLVAELKMKHSCFDWFIPWLSFDEAHELIEKLQADLREMERTRGHIWTEAEVRSRLKHYNDDDSMYYAKVTRPKLVLVYGSDKVADERVIKRVDIDRGIEGALKRFYDSSLKPKELAREQLRRARLFVVIDLLYIHGKSLGATGFIINTPIRTIRDREAEAVGLITGYLNK